MVDLSDKKRVVIKVGTSNITYKNGSLNIRRVEKLIKVFSDLKNSGIEIIFVTSGAVGVGVGRLGLKERPKDMPTKQACASVGQSALMSIYDNEFSKYNHTVGQILMTRDVISNKVRKENVKNTFAKLLDLGVVPVINANDSVSIEELDFDENDTLSAMVAGLADADLLVILTDVDGLYDKNPKTDSDAKLIKEIDTITSEMIASSKTKGSELSSGGMLTKLEAAELAKEQGIPTVMIKGDNPEILYDLFENKAVCTIIKA